MYVLGVLIFKKHKKLLFLAAVLLAAGIPGGKYFFRPPILVVTDSSFVQLYGPLRFSLKALGLSLEFFRRVIPVTVAETAGPDLVALAAEAASPLPWALLVPDRYAGGALQFRESHPETPVLVFGSRADSPADSGLTHVRTDDAQDLYRAGVYAAEFAGEGRIVFLSGQSVVSQRRNLFREGLRAREFAGEPLYLNVATDYSAYSGVGCVIIAGAAAKFLEQNLETPSLLFSWAEPARTPRQIKIVFDDSPLALAAEALRNFPPPPGEMTLPSEPVFLYDRMEGKKDFRNIEAEIQEKFAKS